MDTNGEIISAFSVEDRKHLGMIKTSSQKKQLALYREDRED